MNKKGFTLIELLSVIVLIGLILGIATTGVIRGQKKAKEKTLATKVKNIEKAAILYGQNHRENFVDVKASETKKSLCFETKDDGTVSLISNCKYYDVVINVKDLLGKDDEPYINADKEIDGEKYIVNPVDETKYMNDCEIQIYQKYGKIYAVYNKNEKVGSSTDTKCWK